MSHYAPHRLFPTSLDTQETSYDGDGVEKTIRSHRERKAANAWDQKTRGTIPPKPANQTESLFRHSGWSTTRNRVLQAMRDSEQAAGRIERFTNCGASCEVHVKLDGSAAKLTARYCHDRFCLPCMKARARCISGNLHEWTKHHDPLLITLTLQPRDTSVGETLTHLLKSFARLRASDSWKRHIHSGAYCVEITRGKAKTHWHVHLHAIVLGTYYTQGELSDVWRGASHGSSIVHITRVRNSNKGIDYAAEYASKGWSSDCLADPSWISELFAGLRSRRLFGTFGRWRGRSVEQDTQPSDGFRHLGNLVEIVHHAARGEQWAIGVCRMIGVAVLSDGGKISFVRIKRFPSPREECLGAAARDTIPRGHAFGNQQV